MSKEIVFGSGILLTDDEGRLVISTSDDDSDGGVVLVAEQFAPVAEDNAAGVFKAEERYAVARRTTEGLVLTGVGKLHSISINPLTATPTAGLLSVYDSLTETGTVIYSTWVFATTNSVVWTPDILITNGIYVGFDATLANVSVQVAYRDDVMD